MSSDNEDKFRSYGHDLSLIKDDRIKALHSYWLSIHNGDTLPSRRQIDPLQFPKGVIGYVIIHIPRVRRRGLPWEWEGEEGQLWLR
jgi:hypothetical protein